MKRPAVILAILPSCFLQCNRFPLWQQVGISGNVRAKGSLNFSSLSIRITLRLTAQTVDAHPRRPETAVNELDEFAPQFLGQVDRVASLTAGLADVDDQDGGVLLVSQHRVLEFAQLLGVRAPQGHRGAILSTPGSAS